MEVTRLPEITPENITEINNRQMAKYVHKENVTPYLWQGFLEMPIRMGESVRTAKLYIPDDNPTGSSFIIMNVPEGTDAVDFMITSGWKEISDRVQMPLLVMEPELSGGWKSPEEERPYIEACFEAQRTGIWLDPGFCHYAVGYGKTGAEVQRYVMEHPLNFGGSAFVDASSLSSDYVDRLASSQAVAGQWKYDITMGEVPGVVFLLNENENEETLHVREYWERAAADSSAADRYSAEGPDFFRDIVKAETDAADPASPDTTEKIWAHIGKYYRYGAGYLSNHIYEKADYQKLGVVFRSFTDSLGIDRNFLVYIPERLRNTCEKVPLVLSYHGWSNTMRQQFENTLWHRIADTEGFILVCPENRLYLNPEAGPTTRYMMGNPKWNFMMEGYAEPTEDISYLHDLLQLLKEEYPVDPDRIYANGQSMGCGETLYLAQSEEGDNFAAIASCSGLPLMGQRARAAEKIRNKYRSVVPTFIMMGEYDLWDTDILSGEDTLVSLGADEVLKRVGLASPDNVREVRMHGASSSWKDGRFCNLVWKNHQGVPLFRYSVIDEHCHAITPIECRAAWYEWMSQFRLDHRTGKRYYRGIEIVR